MSFGAGASWIQSSPTSFRVQGTGYRAEMKLGDWITPFTDGVWDLRQVFIRQQTQMIRII